jgi:hypothetical protein
MGNVAGQLLVWVKSPAAVMLEMPHNHAVRLVAKRRVA